MGKRAKIWVLLFVMMCGVTAGDETKTIFLNTEVQDFAKNAGMDFIPTIEFANEFSQRVAWGGAGGQANAKAVLEREIFFGTILNQSLPVMFCDDQNIRQYNHYTGDYSDAALLRVFLAGSFNATTYAVYKENYPLPEFSQGATCCIRQVNATHLMYTYTYDDKIAREKDMRRLGFFGVGEVFIKHLGFDVEFVPGIGEKSCGVSGEDRLKCPSCCTTCFFQKTYPIFWLRVK